MVNWIPPDWEDAEMLKSLGIGTVEELFRDIPKRARMGRIGLQPSLDEASLAARVRGLLERNKPLSGYDIFLGGGFYDRYTPAVVDGILQRSEFYTSYTPYQAEASQGTLQSLFEFQSLWVELTNMEVANASLYDGASALAEGLLMAGRLHEGSRVLVPGNLHWERRSVLENYARGARLTLVDIPWDRSTGLLDFDFIRQESTKDVAGVIVELPDSLGIVDGRLPTLKSMIGDVPLVVSADPMALTLLEPPGSWGADIVVAEGQGFGIPLSYGGPYLGLMATRNAAVRQLPGRLVGATKDARGRRAFTLTLQTREQHIRRSRATSNVCTNHSLMALAFVSYATVLGPRGLQRLALAQAKRVRSLATALGSVRGLRAPLFSAPYLMDVTVGVEGMKVSEFLAGMARKKVLAGTALGDPRPSARGPEPNAFVTSAGEGIDDKAIERFTKAASAVLGGG